MRTAFFNFQTVSVPMKTAEMWVSFGGPPDSPDKKSCDLLLFGRNGHGGAFVGGKYWGASARAPCRSRG